MEHDMMIIYCEDCRDDSCSVSCKIGASASGALAFFHGNIMIDGNKCSGGGGGGAVCKSWKGAKSIPACVADCKKAKTKRLLSETHTDCKRVSSVNAMSTAHEPKIYMSRKR